GARARGCFAGPVWGVGRAAMRRPGRGSGGGGVGAGGAVATKDVPAYAIVAGNPARLVRERFPASIAARLQALAWWDWPHERLRLALKDFRALPVEEFLGRHEALARIHPAHAEAAG